jgi:hypothetical protein
MQQLTEAVERVGVRLDMWSRQLVVWNDHGWAVAKHSPVFGGFLDALEGFDRCSTDATEELGSRIFSPPAR